MKNNIKAFECITVNGEIKYTHAIFGGVAFAKHTRWTGQSEHERFMIDGLHT